MKSVLITCCGLYLIERCGKGKRERLENRLEELCVNSLVLVPLFIVIRRSETCSPSNTKSIRKDLLDPKGFLLYLYLGFTQSHIDKNICHNTS